MPTESVAELATFKRVGLGSLPIPSRFPSSHLLWRGAPPAHPRRDPARDVPSLNYTTN